jgi:hypothetical protein
MSQSSAQRGWWSTSPAGVLMPCPGGFSLSLMTSVRYCRMCRRLKVRTCILCVFGNWMKRGCHRRWVQSCRKASMAGTGIPESVTKSCHLPAGVRF